jgi:hypothetical protein
MVAGVKYRFSNVMGGSTIEISGTTADWIVSTGTGFEVLPTTAGQSADFTVTGAGGAELHVHISVVGWQIPESVTLLRDGERTYQAIGGTGHQVTTVGALNAELVDDSTALRITGAGNFTVRTAEGNGAYEQASRQVTVEVADVEVPGFDYDAFDDKWTGEMIAGAVYQFDNLPEGVVPSFGSDAPSWITPFNGGFRMAPTAAEHSVFSFTVDGKTVNIDATVVAFDMPSSVGLGTGDTAVYTPAPGHMIGVDNLSAPGIAAVNADGCSVTVTGIEGSFTVYSVSSGDDGMVTPARVNVNVIQSDPNIPGFNDDGNNSFSREVVAGNVYRFGNVMGGSEITIVDAPGNPDWVSVVDGTVLRIAPAADAAAGTAGTFDILCNGTTMHVSVTVVRFNLEDAYTMSAGTVKVFGSTDSILSGHSFKVVSSDTAFVRTTGGNLAAYGPAAGVYTVELFCNEAYAVQSESTPFSFTLTAVGFSIDAEKELLEGGDYRFENIIDSGTLVLGGTYEGIAVDAAGTGLVITDFPLAAGSTEDIVLRCGSAEYTVTLKSAGFLIGDSISMMADGYRTVEAVGEGHADITVEVTSGTAPWISASGRELFLGTEADLSVEGSYTIVVTCGTSGGTEFVQKTVALTVQGPNIDPGDFDHDPVTDEWSREIVYGGTYHFENIVPEGGEISRYEITGGDSGWEISLDENSRGVIVTPAGTDEVDLSFELTSDGAVIKMKLTAVAFSDGYGSIKIEQGGTLTVGSSTDLLPAGHEFSTSGIASLSGGLLSVSATGEYAEPGTYTALLVCTDEYAVAGKEATKEIAVTVDLFDSREISVPASGETVEIVAEGHVIAISENGLVSGGPSAAVGSDGRSIVFGASSVSGGVGTLKVTCEGAEITLTVVVGGINMPSIFDPEGPSTYSCTVISGATYRFPLAFPGDSIASASGDWSPSVDDHGRLVITAGEGTATVTFTLASDPLTTYTVNFTAIGFSDSLGDLRVVQGGTRTFEGAAAAALGGRAVTVSSGIASISGEDLVLTAGANTAGEYTVTLSFTDAYADGAVTAEYTAYIDAFADQALSVSQEGGTFDILPDGHETMVLDTAGLADGAPSVSVSGGGVAIGAAEIGEYGTFTLTCEGATITVTLAVTGASVPGGFEPDPSDPSGSTYTYEIVLGGTYVFPDIAPEGQSLSILSDGGWSVSADGRGLRVVPASAGTADVKFELEDGTQYTFRLTAVAFADLPDVSIVAGGEREIGSVLVGASGDHAFETGVGYAAVTGGVLTVTGPDAGTYTVTVTCTDPYADVKAFTTFSLTSTAPSVPGGEEEPGSGDQSASYRLTLINGGSYVFEDILGGAAISVAANSAGASADGADLKISPAAAGDFTVTVTADGFTLTLHLHVVDLNVHDVRMKAGGDFELHGVAPFGHDITVSGADFASVHGGDIVLRGVPAGDYALTVSCDGATAQFGVYALGIDVQRSLVEGGVYDFADLVPPRFGGDDPHLSGAPDWAGFDGRDLKIRPEEPGSYTFDVVWGDVTHSVSFEVVGFELQDEYRMAEGQSLEISGILPSGHTIAVSGASFASGGDGGITITGASAGTYALTLTCEGAAVTTSLVVIAFSIEDRYELQEGESLQIADVVPDGSTLSISGDCPSWIAVDADGNGLAVTSAAKGTWTVVLESEGAQKAVVFAVGSEAAEESDWAETVEHIIEIALFVVVVVILTVYAVEVRKH